MEELSETKREWERYKQDRQMIYEVKNKVNDQVTHFEKSIGKAKIFLKRSKPLHIMMKHTRKRNLWLQAERKIL